MGKGFAHQAANGGGAFPFWFSVAVVGGAFAILVAIIYGVIQLFS